VKRWLVLVAVLIAAPALADTPPPVAPPGAIALLGPVLNVGNLAAELKFYVDGLGMKQLMQMGAPERQETMLGFAADPRAPGVILISDSTKPAQPAFDKGKGFNRLVMRVTDIAGVVARLRAMGYQASDVRDVAMGYRMATATDPEGYRLELVETGKK